MSQLIVRPPRDGDGAALVRAYREAAEYYAAQAPDLFRVPEEEGLADWLQHSVLVASSEDHLVLVAELDGAAVGFVAARILRPGADAARIMMREWGQVRLFIDGLVVKREHWRGGIGTRLMHQAETWGRERGATVVLLDTFVDSDVSVPFYEQHLGYQRRSLRFRKTLA